MAYCQYCGRKVREEAPFCSWCGETLVGEGTDWQQPQIQGAADEAKRKANTYVTLAIILVTAGLAAGGVLCVSLGSVGLLGIAVVCLGIACATYARRHERIASTLRKRLRQ